MYTTTCWTARSTRREEKGTKEPLMNSGNPDHQVNIVQDILKAVGEYNFKSLLCVKAPGVKHHLQTTIFCRINASGREAENEPLTLSDLNETQCGPLSTSTSGAKKMIQIGSEIS